MSEPEKNWNGKAMELLVLKRRLKRGSILSGYVAIAISALTLIATGWHDNISESLDVQSARPWVDTTPVLVKALMDSKEAEFLFQFDIENVGHQPAFKTWVSYGIA